MSRASAGFADFFPNAPSVLKTKRKEPSSDHQPTRAPSRTESPLRSDKGVENAATAGPRRNNDTSAEALEQQHQPEEDDGAHRADSGDLLIGVGSASSLSSTASSVFSSSSSSRQTMSYPGPNTSIHALTPLTNTESSPPDKATSPRPSKTSNDHMSLTNTDTYSAPPPGASQNVAPAEAITPATTPPQTRRQARPGPGEEKGFTVVYDPALDPKIPSNERHKRKATYRNIPRDDIAAPPDPRLAIAGYTTGAHNAARGVNKARLRLAPYTVKPYAPDKNTIGPQPATRILVTGLDPFTPEMQIKTFFSSFGNIAEFDNKIDPATGSFLGICSIRYSDSKPARQGKYPLTAAASAKLAEKEGNGSRIQLRQIKVELDREGRRAARCVDEAVKKNRMRQQKEEAASIRKTADTTPVVIPLSEPPPDAPKGPSGKGGQGPRPHVAPRPIRPEHALVENEPIIDKIKRKPYIFIAHCYVPVLGTTIPHLKKRLKLYQWQEVRLDRTGYYIIFEDSKRGEDECERCYQECNMQALFTYVMNMECEKYGNPNYVRSPSPERVLAEKKKKEVEEEIRREEEQDLEEEKKERAENLDPVTAAKERLHTELLEQIMSDIKTRIAAPAIYDYLDPARHVARRKELGVRDPTLAEAKTPTVLFSAAENVLPHKSKFGKGNKNLRKSLAANLSQNQRRGKGGHHYEVNAFADERRRKPPPKKHNAFRNLHRQMQSFEDEDSDDEQSTLTRDTEEQESRSISRMSSAAPEEEDEIIQIRPSKRRKLEPLWGDADTQDAQARRLFPHLINKDPTDMADGELDQVVHAFPHTSDLYKRAKSELKFRKIQRDAALVFGGEDEEEDSRAGSVQPPTEAATPVDTVEEIQIETPEPEVPIKTEKKKPSKPKKKTKKQALLDEKPEPSPLKSEVEETPPIEPVPLEEAPKVAEIVTENLMSEDPIWGFSIDEPRSTIEEKLDYVMDIDGWQFTVKDAEDLRYLSAALENVRPANVGDPNLFAYKEKHVKKLNTGLDGVAYKEVKIEDYYKPNPTGCARTEGVKKILEAEKSKYLPHRIRVQKAREEREALAKINPNALAQLTKPAVAPKTSTTTSRSNRANNRRLVNEISTQKQALAADGGDNIAIRFNQLKKRKKLVKFDRSAIHNWGLYAQEDISANDMIIEYVGEKVRQKVADIREIKYDKQGVGSSYLFRIDEDSVVDATKKGGIARFINHSCTPNCTAKIIRVDGTKRIVIYALRDIKTNEELTYDYKFEREIGSDDRIPCLCGSVNCKGFLN
ncbi:Histone-lysine n-methyltransferase [Lasiodiplodia theobromae]|uniref:Histone-lysine n-methyltransferase n=1 Tax=Lasiodiplodia theobromae TaxID=45133 RepID=UPI0015C3A8E4|nr:Histone-lysine n-methyltransferase [Lasiodiplodia theobromae]KAF4534808.1 Histone-lysine n-methyltransferase [Lasiodiplodia theobromae]